MNLSANAPRHAPRRGAVLIAMMVVLALVMMLATIWVRRVVDERQQLRRQLIEMQATRLAESGVARARARLGQDANYSGEVWEIPAEMWEPKRSARVEIAVEPGDPTVASRLVTARATYPVGDQRAVRRTRTIRIPRKPTSRLTPETLSPAEGS